MATQKCPKCGSDRIRPGYRRTNIFSKLIFRYNLLCDNCNLEFKGFAIPGTVVSKSKKSAKKFSDPNYLSPEIIRQTKLVEKVETALSNDAEKVETTLSNDVEPVDLETNEIPINIETNSVSAVNLSDESNQFKTKTPKKARNKVKVKQRVKVRF